MDAESEPFAMELDGLPEIVARRNVLDDVLAAEALDELANPQLRDRRVDVLRVVVVDVRELAVGLAQRGCLHQVDGLVQAERVQGNVGGVALIEQSGVGAAVVGGVDADECRVDVERREQLFERDADAAGPRE